MITYSVYVENDKSKVTTDLWTFPLQIRHRCVTGSNAVKPFSLFLLISSTLAKVYSY